MQYRKYIIVLMALFAVSACKKDLDKINTNPNAPINAEPELLLRQVIYDYGENMSYEGFVAGNLLGQYFTAVDFNLFDRHELSSPQYGGKPWLFIYSNLRDNETLLKTARDNSVHGVYEGPALIMKAYITAALTDIYGDVPYFNALQGKDGNVTPQYDAQEQIYTADGGILSNLDKAIEAIKKYDGKVSLKGDVLYNGDLDAWVRFANSLKIKYLMRISDRENVGARLQAIYSSGAYIQSDVQNATFDFTDGPPNNFRMATARIGDFNLFILSETMEEVLKKYNDPRIMTFFRPTEKTPTEFKGLLNGPDASQTSITVADYSRTGIIFRENTSALDANFITSWETKFLLAEAMERGLIGGNAKSIYDEAVQEAFVFWNAIMPTDYLTTGDAAYGMNGANKIEQIITQKWIANIIHGYEGWIEYRRTGYPMLKTIQASFNNDLIPVRLPYPTEEASLNADSYNAASAATDNNSINAKVWWDVQ